MDPITTLQSQIDTAYTSRTPRSRALFDRATKSLPGGDTRSGLHYAPYPAYMDRGLGSRLWDVDGNEYLDFLGNYTSLVHGHAHPKIVAALTAQIPRGTAHGAPTELQITLAETIKQRVPSVELIRFANSGTEAVFNAVRAARAFTGRSWILKMEGGYHGTYDAAKVSVDPGPNGPAWPKGRPDGPGLSPGLTGEVLIAPYNDLPTTKLIIEQNRERLAAVIVEPVMGAAGMIPGDEKFLKGVREAARAANVLFIADEVITFRLSKGGAQELYHLQPDLTAFGKVLGGGLPVGAFGGRGEIMGYYDPRRPEYVSQAGTFNGNAATLAAGIASLELLTPDAIARINELGGRLRDGFESVLKIAGVAASVTGKGSLSHVHFAEEPVRDYRSAARGKRSAIWRWLHLALLTRGIFAAPRGMFIVSTVMTEADIDRCIAGFREALEQVRPLLETLAQRTAR